MCLMYNHEIHPACAAGVVPAQLCSNSAAAGSGAAGRGRNRSVRAARGLAAAAAEQAGALRQGISRPQGSNACFALRGSWGLSLACKEAFQLLPAGIVCEHLCIAHCLALRQPDTPTCGMWAPCNQLTWPMAASFFPTGAAAHAAEVSRAPARAGSRRGCSSSCWWGKGQACTDITARAAVGGHEAAHCFAAVLFQPEG